VGGILFAAAAASITSAQIQPLPATPTGRPLLTSTATAQDPKAAAMTDEEALKAAGLTPDDGKKLLEYLKLRTLSESEQGKIAEIIKRFGADSFAERTKATEEVEFFGPAAVGPLKAAERDADPEVAYRAKLALKKVSKVPHSTVAAAAVRAILKLKPDGAAAALVGFLPLADNEQVADAIREALVGLAVKDGKAEPALVAAMSDPSVARRTVAYVALLTGGPAEELVRVKDAYPLVKEALTREKDVEAKFTGVWTLLLTARDKDFVPELIGMIPQLSRGRIWQVEDYLLQLAGSHPKGGRFLKNPDSLTTARDAWLAWWKEKGGTLNLEKTAYVPRTHGITDVIEMDQSGLRSSGSRAASLGPDLKERWQITNLNSPHDLLVTPDDHVLVVESMINSVTDRSKAGVILKRIIVTVQPVNIFRTPDGGYVVVCRNQVVQLDKDTAQVASYTRSTSDIVAGLRLPGGDVIVLTTTAKGDTPNCIRLDSKLKDLKKPLTLGPITASQWMDAVGENRILVCETDRVAEYDLQTGKQTWSHECEGPTSCQRLPNGNTLIASLNANRLFEVDPSGEAVWEYKATDRNGLRVGRGRRK
jgi:hypothetical protein